MKVASLWFAAAPLLIVSASAADPPPAGALAVRISRLRSDEGRVGCMLYTSAKGFPTDPSSAAQKRWCDIKEKVSICAFDPIPAGTYAIGCFHDENGNGKLDTGVFGIPTEGTVVSNDAKGFMGPPSFNKARFHFPGVATRLELPIGY